MKCTNCGALIDDNARFCSYCGQRTGQDGGIGNMPDPFEIQSNERGGSQESGNYFQNPVSRPNNSGGRYNYNDNEYRPRDDSNIFGILAIVFGLMGSWLGIIFGIVGLSKYKEPGNRKLCVAGIIISIVMFVVYIMLTVFLMSYMFSYSYYY